jgi:membrane-associated protease RseP (regulator of RpoE activity)
VTTAALAPKEVHEGPPAQEERRGALWRLLAVIAIAVAVATLTGVGSTVLVIAAIFVVILIHEAGHLGAAKACGIKVTEYFVGFGPRLWSFRRGETEYGVKALPLGGYCRIVGMIDMEEVDPADEPRTYRQHPVWQRVFVSLAGPATHFIVAFGLLFAMFFVTGDNSNVITNPAANAPITGITGLTTGQSPAQEAGLRVGDRIVSVDGRRFSGYDQMKAFLTAHPGQQVSLQINRGGQLLTLHPVLTDLSKVRVAGSDAPPPASKPTGFLGIEVSPVTHLGFASSAGHAVTGIGTITAKTVGAIPSAVAGTVHSVMSPQAANNPNTPRFESPVGVVRLAHQATTVGPSEVLYLLAVITLFVGIFNLLPIPPLDGSHVAVALYEKARSRRGRMHHADGRKLVPLLYAGFLLIALLGLSALFLDLRNLIS